MSSNFDDLANALAPEFAARHAPSRHRASPQRSPATTTPDGNARRMMAVAGVQTTAGRK